MMSDFLLIIIFVSNEFHVKVNLIALVFIQLRFKLTAV